MESTSAVSIWESLEQADKAATLAINSVHCPASDWIWTVFSDITVWIPLYLVVLVFMFIKLGWKRATIFTIACILTIVCCDQFSNVCKDFFGRLRPCHDATMVDAGLRLLEKMGGKYGFYSAHAANAMGFALCTSIAFKTKTKACAYTWGITIWALMVAISRVFVGKHFLGDIIVGLGIGALFAWILASFARLAIRRIRL